MVITKIIGGIGNQLFQYAAGRSLSEHHKTELKLDVLSFDNYKLRNFDLSKFNFQIHTSSLEEVNRYIPKTIPEKLINKVTPINKRRFFKESYFHYNKLFEYLGADVYVKGYFQSEKYFKPIEGLIRKEFTLKSEILESVNYFGNQLSNNNSVSIHFRRGDYKNEHVNEYHGTLSLSYYLNAIKLINESITNPQYYIFSDDIEWVKRNISIPNSTIVSEEISKNHYEDLFLMSQCRHNIIANSSFSWWAAWLNPNPHKMVIAPKKWFIKGPQDIYDLFPLSWITIN